MRSALWILLFPILLTGAPPALAFRFVNPVEGAVITAGSEVRIELDPEGVNQLMAVLFTASVGVLKEKLDAFPPWTWRVGIPPNYVGPLTFSATGRVLGQKNGWAPHAEVTIQVILPVQPTVRPSGRLLPPDRPIAIRFPSNRGKLDHRGKPSSRPERFDEGRRGKDHHHQKNRE